jgi:NAD(P)-dependent dehydrogenase (short-subunit alcohol dehydrogenase family)
LLLNRPSPRAESSLADLRSAVPDAHFEAIDCDLQDLASVQTAIEHVTANHDVLDVLCNNAGVMALKDQATKDGYDVQMQTNCISHFLLTKGLFPLLNRSSDARIVNHTSMARLGPNLEASYFGKNGGDLGGDGDGSAGFGGPRWARYHQTKLANCAFTYGLKQRLDAAGNKHVKALMAHPGLSATNLQVTTAGDGGMQLNTSFMDGAQSAEDGASGIIRCCMDPKAQSGDFYGPAEWVGFPDRIEPEPLLHDSENIRINWEGCEAAVGPFQI